ncbi:MAG: cupin domain-containing protein [Chloroflexota bacterium]
MKVIKVSQVPKEPSTNAKLFTGPVTSQVILDTENIRIRQVNFSRGVRNKFHSHSSEQILIITEGKGIVATEKEEITVVPGDVIIFPAGEKHWHGATKDTTFSHLYVIGPGQQTTQLED